MAKIKFLFAFMLMLGTASVFGQSAERKVSKFEAGTVLTKEDLGFLSLVGNKKVLTTKGGDVSEAKLAGKKFNAGQKLSSDDANAINASISAFRKVNPGVVGPTKESTPPPAALLRGLKDVSGAAWCWYWYQWCDAYGRCYWYKQWYIC